jgi:hypothetical protein
MSNARCFNNEFIRAILEWPAVKTSRNFDLTNPIGSGANLIIMCNRHYPCSTFAGMIAATKKPGSMPGFLPVHPSASSLTPR